jgi:hypothetical protein
VLQACFKEDEEVTGVVLEEGGAGGEECLKHLECRKNSISIWLSVYAPEIVPEVGPGI